MKNKLFIMVLVIMLVSVTAIPAFAGPPDKAFGAWEYGPDTMVFEEVGCNTFIFMTDSGKFTGTFEGTENEEGVVAIHCNGKASFKGNLIFEGTVAGSYWGTMEMRIVGTSPDYSLWQGTWVILGGTDGLENIKGQGKWYGPPGDLTYEGNYHFEPD